MDGLIPNDVISSKIYFIRGKKVMLDRDLADLYDVTTKAFNQAVKRNAKRFSDDFVFVLNFKEFSDLRAQFVTSSWGGTRYLPYAFTAQDVVMRSGVLNSKRAVNVNIGTMRTFVKLRELMSIHSDLYKRLNKVEINRLDQKKEIRQIHQVIDEMLNLLVTLKGKSKKIGFRK